MCRKLHIKPCEDVEQPGKSPTFTPRANITVIYTWKHVTDMCLKFDENPSYSA